MSRCVKKSKRGLSPVVASVLLILLDLVLATLIFLWARGFLSEQIEKFGTPIESLCESVDFDVAVIGGFTTEEAFEVVNRGNINIFRLEVKLVKGGDSIFRKFEHNINQGKSVRGDIYLKMDDNSIPDKVIVYPALVGVADAGSNKVFTCLDYGKSINRGI